MKNKLTNRFYHFKQFHRGRMINAKAGYTTGHELLRDTVGTTTDNITALFGFTGGITIPYLMWGHIQRAVSTLGHDTDSTAMLLTFFSAFLVGKICHSIPMVVPGLIGGTIGVAIDLRQSTKSSSQKIDTDTPPKNTTIHP